MQNTAERSIHVATPSGRVFVHDATRAPWIEAGKPGLHHKLVRGDEAKGTFLGLLAFDALVSSGLHQHTGVATSYMLSGSLTDYWDTYREGVTGINLQGSTHDAICYAQCSMVSRLEAPVLYPQDFPYTHCIAARVTARSLGFQPDFFAPHVSRSEGDCEVPEEIGRAQRSPRRTHP